MVEVSVGGQAWKFRDPSGCLARRSRSPSAGLEETCPQAEELWTDLGDSDAAKGWRATWTLAEHAEPSLKILAARLQRETAPDPKRTAGSVMARPGNLGADGQFQAAAIVKTLAEGAPDAWLTRHAAAVERRLLDQVGKAVPHEK